MAAIYAFDGSALTEGLQGCYTCDAAVQMARRMAEQRGEPVELHDDDGVWRVEPSGDIAEAGYIVEGRGEDGRWSREHVEAAGSASFGSQDDAEAAIDSLIDTCGWSRDELRVREV